MAETEKKYTARKTIEKRIEYIEKQIEGHKHFSMFNAIIGAYQELMKNNNLEDIEAGWVSLRTTCKTYGIETNEGSNGISTEDYNAVVEYVDNHDGRPETWSDAQVLLYNMANRPNKSGNITNIEKGKEHARNKIINALARAAKNNLWKIGNKTIKAPATATPPKKDKKVVIQEAPKEGA